MVKKDPWWLTVPWMQVAMAAGVGGVLLRQDPAFRAEAGVFARQAALTVGACSVLWWALKPAPPQRDDEDEFAHFGVVGLSRSGKTGWAILKVLEWQRRRWGWCWLSIKGGRGLLPYLPTGAVDSVDLICPGSPRPRGINILRLLTQAPEEREQVADQLAELVERLHPSTSDLMREMTRLGTLAILEYGVKNKREVALPDLYRFFASLTRRQEILGYSSNPTIRDAFDEESNSVQKTLEAVQRQIRRLLSSRALVLSLGRSGSDQVDLRKAMATGRGVIVDASDTDLGPGQASLINEIIASKIQMYTAQRSKEEPGYGVIADEVQEYQGSGHSFRRGLALAAEFRVAWALINQFREGQLTSTMQAAVNLAGTHIFFRVAPADAGPAVKTLGGATTADQLVQLPKRHFWTVERHDGRPVIRQGQTLDLPAPDPEVERAIRRQNERGPWAEAILQSIYRAMGESGGPKLWG